VASVPSGAAIAADKRNNTIFYAGSGATFYRSTDTGATFIKVASALGKATAVKDIAAHPDVAGEVWVSTDVGLFRSTDFGVTFTAAGASSLSKTEQISIGKGEGTAWNVYAFGVGAAGAKLYATADNGATFVDIQGDQGFGSMGANRVVGSGNVAGQVYVGTNGRGVFYAQVSVPGGGGGANPSASSTSAVPSASSSAVESACPTTMSTSTVKPPASSSSSPVVIPTSTTTTAKPPATSAPALAQKWQQCGGNGWQGPTVCVAGSTCKKQNDWYYQCL
jgi:xyloglucan-specific exo-beta-1,4-glucanase